MNKSNKTDSVRPSKGQAARPQFPHERDEKTGMTDGLPSEVVQHGARDLKRGLQDTNCSPESDAAYQKLRK